MTSFDSCRTCVELGGSCAVRPVLDGWTGQAPSEAIVEKAARAIQGAIDPFEDTRGSVAYKRHLAEVVFKKALATALARARGERAGVPHL